jgi:hypothetical protein
MHYFLVQPKTKTKKQKQVVHKKKERLSPKLKEIKARLVFNLLLRALKYNPKKNY